MRLRSRRYRWKAGRFLFTPSTRRVYTDTGMFGPSSAASSVDGYFRALAKNIDFCTLPFIVVPYVRLKLLSAVKNVDITRLRSSRFGAVRYWLKPAWSIFTLRPSASVTDG